MKVFFSVPMLLVLLVAVLLLSGCAVPGILVSPEDEAKELADQTDEVKLLIYVEQQLLKIQDCTMEKVESAIAMASPSQAPNAEQMVQIELSIEQLKQCTLVLEKTAAKQAENQYLVSYKFVSSGGCSLELLSGAESITEVEVNTETKTTNVVKGAIPKSQIQGMQTMLQSLGSCAPLTLFIG